MITGAETAHLTPKTPTIYLEGKLPLVIEKTAAELGLRDGQVVQGTLESKLDTLRLNLQNLQPGAYIDLPKDLPADAKVPLILYQTRYWRGGAFRWPFNMFLSNFSTTYGKLIEQVIYSGYAVMAVDVRGSGASTGSRDYPWTIDEIKDGAELVDFTPEEA